MGPSAPTSSSLLSDTHTEFRSAQLDLEPSHVTLGNEDGRTVAWLRGEFDLCTVAELSEAITAAITFHDADLVIDLGAVDFIDAATVGVIIRARALLDGRSRRLTVRAPSGLPRRIFDVCDLGHLVESHHEAGVGPHTSTGA